MRNNLRKSTLSDAAAIHALIQFYADRKEMLPRSLNEIYENIRDFTVLEIAGEILACSCLHVCWKDLAEIKSLAVTEQHRNKGYGSLLIKYELEEAEELGAETVFALTFQPEFFKKHGFRTVEKDSLPKKVWTECVRCVHFPDCGEVAVVYDLAPQPSRA